MRQYHKLLRHILEKGVRKSDRTGTGTISTFGYEMRFDLSEGFPVLTTKKLHLRSIIHELLWFLNGDTNIKYLQENGVRIWNEWADENGDLGPVYGKQWRSWGKPDGSTVDQISRAVDLIKNNPDSRRIIVNAWNVGELDEMALTPCHCLFQFYVADGKLSCLLYQRSADTFLGVPFNIASYALLTMMMAQVCDLEPGEFIHHFGDVHLYNNHIEQAELQLSRSVRTLPTLKINPAVDDFLEFVSIRLMAENQDLRYFIKALTLFGKALNGWYLKWDVRDAIYHDFVTELNGLQSLKFDVVVNLFKNVESIKSYANKLVNDEYLQYVLDFLSKYKDNDGMSLKQITITAYNITEEFEFPDKFKKLFYDINWKIVIAKHLGEQRIRIQKMNNQNKAMTVINDFSRVIQNVDSLIQYMRHSCIDR